MEKESAKESAKVLRDPKVPHIIPPYLPVEAPSTAGTPDIPSTSMSPAMTLPKSTSSTEIQSSLAEEKPPTSFKTRDTAPLEGTSVVHNTFEPEYGISLQPSHSATETATETKRTDRKAKKGARWADEEGHSLDGRSSSFEILVENGLLASGPAIEEVRGFPQVSDSFRKSKTPSFMSKSSLFVLSFLSWFCKTIDHTSNLVYRIPQILKACSTETQAKFIQALQQGSTPVWKYLNPCEERGKHSARATHPKSSMTLLLSNLEMRSWFS